MKNRKRRHPAGRLGVERLDQRLCMAMASISGGKAVSEASSGVILRVTLSEPLSQPASVRLSTDGSTASLNADYRFSPNLPSGTVVFQPGETAKNVAIVLRNDTLREDSETIRVSLGSPVNCDIENGVTTVTILDDDSYSASLVGPASKVSPGGAAECRIQLSSPATKAESFRIFTDSDSANAGVDFQGVAGTIVTIPRGVSSARFVIQTSAAVGYRPEKSFVVRAVSVGDTPSPEPVRVTIAANSTPPPVVSVADVSIAEGDEGVSQAVFTVSLSQPYARPVSVNYSTADGTATTAGNDYSATSGTLAFDPGESTKTVVVNVVGDIVFEASETFRLVLSGPVNAKLGRASGTCTITNDDPSPPQPAITISSPRITEGNAGSTVASFVVSLSSSFVLPVTVSYATQDGTAGVADYLPARGRLEFAPGETTKTVNVMVLGDTVYENDETFGLRLFNPAYATIAQAVGTATILNDDPPPPQPTISIAAGSVLEGNSGVTTANFVVTLSNTYYQRVTVRYATADGTATTADGDYVAASGELSFEPGQTRQTVSVSVVGDTKVENDETFSVVLSSPTLSTLVASTATATIRNDDLPLPSVSVASVSANEGNSGSTPFVFTLTLSAASAQAVTVQYSTADGTATTADSDYQSASGTVTFAPGETSKTVSVAIIGDAKIESDETFTFTLSAPSNALLGTAVATGTILNDDAATPASAFTIDVVFPDNSLTNSQQGFFKQAATRWSQIIVGDLPDVTVNGVLIDDIRIEAVGQYIDGAYGVLGHGGPQWTGGPRPPATGSMAFDTADLARMESDGTLLPVILHEMGHALGLGTMWDYRGLMGSGGYIGANALREYKTIFGMPNATYIPTAGTGHWSESVFKTELMTPIAEQPGTPMPISRITVGSLQDLGYVVNYAAADVFTAPAPVQGDVSATSSSQALLAAFANLQFIESSSKQSVNSRRWG